MSVLLPVRWVAATIIPQLALLLKGRVRKIVGVAPATGGPPGGHDPCVTAVTPTHFPARPEKRLRLLRKSVAATHDLASDVAGLDP